MIKDDLKAVLDSAIIWHRDLQRTIAQRSQNTESLAQQQWRERYAGDEATLAQLVEALETAYALCDKVTWKSNE